MMRTRLLVAALSAVSLGVLTAPPFAAQTSTPPRPAVQVSHLTPAGNDSWPADLNRDGKTDLVGAGGIVLLGRGDGTFGAPMYSGIAAVPLGVGDFNNDARIDVVVSGAAILPGNGNGTFGSPRPVTGPPGPGSNTGLPDSNALVADFNNDGKRDLGLLSGTAIDIHPGNGDFTFGPKMSLPLNAQNDFQPQGIGVDFNGDGRRDIAATSSEGVVVFTNQGGLLFGAATIAISRPLWDITAGDLNGDSRLDLVVASTDFGAQSYAPGQVLTLLGNGNGTFQPPVTHDVGQFGSVSVVVGDFNADGRLDVATGNRSAETEDLRFFYHYWDTVTILAGRGDGTFATPASFALDYATGWANERFANQHGELNTSDLNGDGRTDLIASPGAIVLMTAPRANRPPVVNAGPDFFSDYDGWACFEPLVSDPDFDALRVVIDTTDGAVGFPEACLLGVGGNVTIRVSDGRGGTASDDVGVVGTQRDASLAITEPDAAETVPRNSTFTITWDASDSELSRPIARFRAEWSANNGQTFSPIAGCSNLPPITRQCQWTTSATVTNTARVRVIADDAAGALVRLANSERFSIVAGPRTSLPDNWSQLNVGLVTVPGSATFDGSTFTVRGSGADIWGTDDEFYLVSQSRFGDFDLTARVTSVENVNQWTKAGLMVRNQAFRAAHASVFATPSAVKGVSVQVRHADGQQTEEAVRRALAPPVWLKAMRRGTAVTFAYRRTGSDPWTILQTVSVALRDPVVAGLAVSSHVDGRLATATFDNVSLLGVPAWTSTDIGAVGLAGRRVPGGNITTTTLEGSGADIWGTADAFHYEHVNWYGGDGTITARVLGVENTHAWAKAGIMFRESTDADSKQVMAIVSPGKGLAMQYRAATGGISANAGLAPGMAPRWLRITRIGNSFTSAWSADGATWTTLGSITVAMRRDIIAGLAVTSHNNGTLATAVFDDIVVER